jgi:hypothetical protein
MSDMKNRAKSEMLKELSKTMSDDQNSPLKDIMGKKLQKVTVMSDSKKGLEKGLSKAEQILKKKESMNPDMESMDHAESPLESPEEEDAEHEASESESEESMEDMPTDKEHIMEMIAVLQKKLENC